MPEKRLELNEQNLPFLKLIGSHMPGGFFIYQAREPEELLYVNRAVIDIFGCDDLEDFKRLTGFTFKGMLHPEDYDAISASITEQIDASEDQMDYVEYRIIRKDGAVRWVDDYGHYTVTEAYGGVYYVFISDITEKREQQEKDKAVREAVIQALTNSYNTVWLINDVETESCSLYHGDVSEGSIHAEAIRNALSHAKYTDTKTEYVKTMVAEEDRAWMQVEIGLPNIIRQLRDQDSFSVTFIRALEEGPRYYRIDFGKVNMPDGKMGVAMCFKDVDEEIREEQIVQQALMEGKRAEEENRRLAEEVESAAKLAQLFGSVASLLTNMPAMSFSKEASTGRYLACNQSFAEYAHKGSPEGVIGLTDHEIFDKATADHFLEDDRKALSMDEPYIFFEDVPDAKGNPRNLQTTKMKFTDATGRLCTLGMCVDVTEMTRIKSAEAEARVKQEELERQLQLQEKLLEEERRRTQQEKLITALSSDYRGVYYVELDKDEGICYQIHSELDNGFRVGEHFSFLRDITGYADRYVTEQYREEFLRFIQPANIREALKAERVISYRYLAVQNGKETYEMIRFAGVRHPEDRDDHFVHSVSMCFMDVDAEMRRTLEQSQALSAALATAEDASKTKSAFLSNMSHEIRTPITGILGMNEMIRRESDSEDVLAYSENIRKAGASLLGIINDILDFSKIESGKMELIEVDYSLPGLVRDAVNLMKLRAEEKGLFFSVDMDPALPAGLHGDEIRIKQILTNLLSNAVKYTDKGEVHLSLRQLGRNGNAARLRISVADTGAGIKPEDMSKLFTAFERLDQIRTRKILGTGLGLTITQKMLALMGSVLEVESVYEKGSTFSFVLRQRISDPTAVGVFDPLSATERTGKARSRTPFVAPEARILIVDDTPMNIQVISGLLKRTQMKIDTALSGAEGIDCFRETEYDLVFMDYRMPVMDGIETLHKIRELFPEKFKRTPIICLTASAVSGTKEFMIGSGFTDYLSKPVDTEEMENTLIRYLPVEKIVLTEGDGEKDPLAALPPELFEIPLLDPKAGVSFCGDAEGYLDALKTYEGSIVAKAAEIEKSLEGPDLPKYTLLVHSLKSTSRAVGAAALAEQAAALERASNNKDTATVLRDTPALLAAYRSLKEPLERLLRPDAPMAVALSPLSEAEFDDAVATLRELCGMFDSDSVQMVMDMLSGSSIPMSRVKQYDRIRDAAHRLDWDALAEATR